MPYRRLLDSQLETVKKLLGVGKPLALTDRCGVLGEGSRVAYGAVVKIFDDGYGVLLDGASRWRRFDAARVNPERSDVPFAQVATEAVVSPATVTQHACMYGIKSPEREAPEGGGRPKGSKDKTPREGRSEHRQPAFDLFDAGKTQAEVTETLGIHRQQVHRFHKQWIALRSDGGTKK